MPLKTIARKLQGSPSAWLLSILLHAFVLIRFVGPAVAPLIPEGHWVEMVPTQRPTTSPQRHRPPISGPEDPTSVTADKSTAPSAPALGNTKQSTGLSGRIGDTNGTQASIRDRYLYELEAFINQRKVYPASARHMHLSGKVEVAFHLDMDGSIKDPHVVRPCIHDVLNKAAVQLVRAAGRFQPIPAELAVPSLHVTVPIEYELQ